MKKLLILTLAAGVFMSFTPAFALLRSDYSSIEGPVLAKKVETNQLVVRNGSGGEQTFNADPGQMASVQVGDTVLILHETISPVIGTMVVTQHKQ